MKVAVAMALYNGERFIEEQLDCIRLQTRNVDHVVMCDDGSKDDTVNKVKEYIEKYDLAETWSLHRNEQNLGYIKNFYKAMTLCEADVIFLADQDDIWELDKIEKMTQVMEESPSITLLSSKYGIIDGEGNRIKTVMHKESEEKKTCTAVQVIDIMRAYNWPGMAMCIRKTFFEEVYESLKEHKIPHDLAFAILAADRGEFFEYDYTGVYHRRHNNNTAKEEHRIFKLLNRERKEAEIIETKTQLTNLSDAKLNIKKESEEMIDYKIAYLNKRYACLHEGKARELIKLYKNDAYKMLRIASFLCDFWIVTIGRWAQK
ncbi:MAG: glycosyltransferase [Agathobacter sp.]|nr:glycosyltransferase [Agathobacter sp.]